MIIKMSWRVEFWSEAEQHFLQGMTFNNLDEASRRLLDTLDGRIVRITEEEVYV
jgi:hypothetical protein